MALLIKMIYTKEQMQYPKVFIPALIQSLTYKKWNAGFCTEGNVLVTMYIIMCIAKQVQ